jgi:hypothetical protein
MATSNKSVFGPRQLETTRKLIEDDAALQPTFGLPVPDPTFPRGGICAVGWLAGSGDVTPLRTTSGGMHPGEHSTPYPTVTGQKDKG